MRGNDYDFSKDNKFSFSLKEQLENAFKASSSQISESLSQSFRQAVNNLGSAFQDVCSKSAKNGLETVIKELKSLSSSMFSQLKPKDSSFSFLGSLFSSPLVGGAIKVGLGSLFEGVLAFFKSLSQQKQESIEKLYQEKLDSLKSTFDKEISLRSENIKKLDKKLAAFSKAFQSGQIGAGEYHQISNQIAQEKKKEELEQERAKKLRDLQILELTKKKEYELENSKWFSNKKKLNQLQSEIAQLKQRQTKALQASSLKEVNLASQGALTRVDKPTLFLAGEKGEELVKIKPLQAPIHPILEEKNTVEQQVFNFSINGFIGDEIALARRLTQLIQNSIHTLGEKEFRR